MGIVEELIEIWLNEVCNISTPSVKVFSIDGTKCTICRNYGSELRIDYIIISSSRYIAFIPKMNITRMFCKFIA